MKNLVMVFLFLSGSLMAQETYYSEDFQGVVIPQGQNSTTTFPAQWNNYDRLLIGRILNTRNQFIIFPNNGSDPAGVGSPVFFIHPQTTLKFKVAVTDKASPGKLEIKLYREDPIVTVASIDFSAIEAYDASFTTENPAAKFEKEIDLSAYAGQQLQFFFEMDTTAPLALLYLDDIQLTEGKTMALADPVNEKIAVYPNPVTDYLTIGGLTSKENHIYTLNGGLVKTTTANRIWVGDLPAGVYLLKTVDENGNSYTRKVIKK